MAISRGSTEKDFEGGLMPFRTGGSGAASFFGDDVVLAVFLD